MEIMIKHTSPGYKRLAAALVTALIACTFVTSAEAMDPTVPAPAPTRLQANVLCMYNSSGTYADQPEINWYAGWSAATSMGDYTIPETASVVKQYTGLQYAGVEFYTPNAIDAGDFTMLHFDLWTPNANQFGVKLVSLSPTIDPQINFISGSGVITSNSWLSIDIALSQFLAANPSLVLSGLQQLLWVDNGTVGGGVQGGDFYIDNVYFYRTPPDTNGVHASIVSGTLVSWTASSANSYQPQKSADNSNWTDFGPVLSGNAITSRFDAVKSPFYHVLEMTPGNVTPNPGFETVDVNAIGAANWNIAVQPNTGASMWVTNQYGVLSAHGGTNFLFIESNTSATGPVAAPNTDVRSDLFPITAGISYQLPFYAANPVKTGGANPQYHVFFYDADNALVGGPIFTSFAAVGSAWTLVTNTVTPPAGATQMTIGCIQAMGAGNGWDWVTLIDDVKLTASSAADSTHVLPATTQPGVQISWASTNGLNYQVQSQGDLTDSWWNFGGLVSGNGTTKTATDSSSEPRKFYRVLQIE